MRMLSSVRWQLSLSFVLCPWEKLMSFYNTMIVKFNSFGYKLNWYHCGGLLAP